MNLRRIALVATLLSISVPATAQWSSDPLENLVVADGSGDQILPKIAPTADGGCFVSWFDSIGNGFDVRVQKIDAAGNEVFAHNGVLVSDRSFSSVQDYGLDVDAFGNAILAFRDDGGVGTQVTAAKVSPTGVLLWGPTNVQLTSTSDFVAAPRIAGTSDGGVVVAWTQDVNAHVQKLDAAGTAIWAADIVLSPDVGSYSPSDLHDAGPDAILSWVHQVGGFGSPRHILAQKFDADGNGLWGASALTLFDSGSLQFGNFPSFEPDGSGGALFSWYDAGSLQLQCYAQHVSSAGLEMFPHNGSAASTNAVRIRVSPSISHDSGSGETYLFWTEQNSSQSQSGLYGQKFDATGNRQWTDNGAMLVGLGSASITFVSTVRLSSETFVYWDRSTSFGVDVILGARVDGSGAIDVGPFDVASTPSSKSRLTAAGSSADFAILAWGDDRADAGDILLQNVNSDGTLGGDVADVGEGALPSGEQFGAGLDIFPNPSTGRTNLSFDLAAASSLNIVVLDSGGRVVRRLLTATHFSAGAHSIVWDGRDEAGRVVASGVYHASIRSGDFGHSRTLLRLR